MSLAGTQALNIPENQQQMDFPIKCMVEGRILSKAGLVAVILLAWPGLSWTHAEDEKSAMPPAEARFDILEYRVLGTNKLSGLKVEESVYPFLGPDRTKEDVEQARNALEKAYRDAGYQAVSVQVPPQKPQDGVVILQVYEGQVARLRVRGAKYYSPDAIKAAAPSVAEGQTVNFNDLTLDLMRLNQQADRRVTPSLQAGAEPGTVDVDLTVQDNLPLHGSVEINNRYSAGTSPLRLNGSASYNNLWQMGHTVGLSFQISPQEISEVQVFSGYYLAPIPRVDWLSIMLQGTIQNSSVSTLGGSAVAGQGNSVGLRTIMNLPTPKGTELYHSVTLGVDYKDFDQGLNIGASTISTPITYYPFSIDYNGTWLGRGYSTVLNLGLNFHLRGMGSSPDEFDSKRFNADGNYVYLRGEVSHTHELPGKMQIFGRIQGQAANDPLIDSEQFSGGGLTTVRGYLESEVLGDNAILGTLELRSPSLSTWLGKKVNDWRFYVFGDAGMVTLNDALPEQQDRFDLASYGIGTRIRVLDHLDGSLNLGFPLIDQSPTQTGDLLLTFQMAADF